MARTTADREELDTAGPAGPGVWAPLLDLLAATLMVFMLVTFLQKLLSLEELETLWIRQQQERFAMLTRQHLAEDLARGDLAMERKQNALVLTFSDQVLFESGDYLLKPAGLPLLERCRSLLASAGAEGFEWVQIEGHTDSLAVRRTDYPSNNWQLSAARAISVVEFLVDDALIDPARLSATGYSFYKPAAGNESEADRELNRRIEMRVFFAGMTDRSARAAGQTKTEPRISGE